ncbi:hypothetical protein EW145_g4550 [Phellinidium pouzarii]|uniref:Amino acid permease/ SLC12A domain-containing protein n=1 Tax=Phellinidium pouzarii TaxID=167371 RepID=A0A4V3XCG5_9AGAM|nr:hypothetical protein EW145_g4550 [Phellinidium pouzarii]
MNAVFCLHLAIIQVMDVPVDVSILPHVEEPEISESDRRLVDLGYKPEFKRELSLFGVLGMSFCAIGILTGMSSAFQTGLFSGGPLGLFWGWNLVHVLDRLVSCRDLQCLSDDGRTLFLVCTGWLYTVAMIFTGTSGNLSTALYIASLAEVGSGRTLTRIEIAALAWCVNILSGIINTVGTKAIGHMSAFNVWWTLGGTVVLIVTLLVKAPALNSAEFVFTDFENFTGWQSKGFVVLLGFLQAIYSLEGCETAAQVAEEATRAELLAPLGIVTSILGSWLIGLAYMLSLLYSVQSIPAIASSSLALSIAQLFLDVAGKRLALVCLLVVGLAQGMAAATAYTASARLMYALARDGAVPACARGAFVRLNKGQAPYVGVWVSVGVGCVISCAYIGSTVAFNAILSSAAVSVMLSYLQPIIIRVFWPSSMKDRGPFHLGKWSWAINFTSFLFAVLVCVLFVLPTAHPTTTQNMNYAVVAIGALLIITALAWVCWGRQHFDGPMKTIVAGQEAFGEVGADIGYGKGKEEKSERLVK